MLRKRNNRIKGFSELIGIYDLHFMIKELERKKWKRIPLVSYDAHLIHCDNIKKNGQYSVDYTEGQSVDAFQLALRLNAEIRKRRVQLVAFDVSRTILDYVVTKELQDEAAKLIVDYLQKLGISVSNERVINAFDKGFAEYSRNRLLDGMEGNELEVYKKYIISKIDGCSQIQDEQINMIIKLWREHSVVFRCDYEAIERTVEFFKSFGIKVVTVSDMLGEMTEYALNEVGLYKKFDAHFSSNDFKYRKACKIKSLFTFVNEAFDILPQHCLMIGNDLTDDIIPAHNLGWRTVYLGFGKSSALTADLDITKVEDLIPALLSQNFEWFPSLNSTRFISDAFVSVNDDEIVSLQFKIRAIAKRITDRELRTKIYRRYLTSFLGEGTRIGNELEIRYADNIYIGNNCQLNDDITILNEGPVIIGNDVMIARNVFLSTFFMIGNWECCKMNYPPKKREIQCVAVYP